MFGPQLQGYKSGIEQKNIYIYIYTHMSNIPVANFPDHGFFVGSGILSYHYGG